MSKQVSWVLELNVQPEHKEAFPALVEEMVTATQANEPGTLDYHWSTGEGGTVCQIYERYADSDAVLAHLANFGEHFAARFMEILAPTRFVVYGEPNQEVRDALAGFGPTYMESVGGFSR